MKKISHFSIAATSFLLAACQGEVVEYDNTITTKFNLEKVTTLVTQEELNALAKNLRIKYQFISNVETDCPNLNGAEVKHCYSAEVHLSVPKGSPSYYSDKKEWQLNYASIPKLCK